MPRRIWQDEWILNTYMKTMSQISVIEVAAANEKKW